jgi:hypothetical protein
MSETAKEKVLAAYPKAKLIVDGRLFTVLTGTGILVALGRASTPNMAWEDAASKLTRQNVRAGYATIHQPTGKWWWINPDNGATEPVGPFETRAEAEAWPAPLSDKHEYSPFPRGYALEASAVCAKCGRERNDCEYHLEPDPSTLHETPSLQVVMHEGLQAVCKNTEHHGKRSLYSCCIAAIPVPEKSCTQSKTEEVGGVKRPRSISITCEDGVPREFMLTDQADAYMDHLEQQVKELDLRNTRLLNDASIWRNRAISAEEDLAGSNRLEKR